MEITEAIKHAIDGNALLFLGSGFSVEAKPIKGSKFLTGKKLADHLYKECGIEPPNDELNYAAQRYEKKFGAAQLVSELQELFTASEVHAHHERFAEINWKSIYTTNYDDVVEKAFAKQKKKIRPVTPEKDTREYTSNRNICVHINGYIETLTTESLNESFKLTNTSYLTESFSKSKWSFLFRRTLEASRAVIFVGYSLYDIDIQRIIYADGSLKEKIIFIEPLGKSLEDYEDSIQEEFGTVIPIGIDGFWEEYDKISKSYVPEKTSNSLFAFEEILAPEAISDFRYDNMFDLLFKGEHKLELIWNCVHNSTVDNYFITRNSHDMVLDQIEKGMKNVIVHSDVANGKTMFLLGLACRLISSGYRVFWLKDDIYDVWDEVNYISSLSVPIVIVVENFSRRTEELKYINLKRSDSTVLLSSAKTSLYEVAQEELTNLVDPSLTFDIDLNKLADNEIILLNTILRKYQLWGERDDWNEKNKKVI